jgi:hypothetical protein
MPRLRSGASADRRKCFRLFSDGGALPRRRYAHAAEDNPASVFESYGVFTPFVSPRQKDTLSIMDYAKIEMQGPKG